MSIFPDYAKQKKSDSAENNGAEPRAQRAAKQHTSKAQAQRPGEAGIAASKRHRFDKFAKCVAANLLEALRVTLTVFASPDKERWPMVRLISHLKGAEELAREMLREIAAKLTILPGKAWERVRAPQSAPEEAAERAPYFRLGEKTSRIPSPVEDHNEPNTVGRSPERSEPEGHTRQRPGEAGTAASTLEKRLQALEDVLAHPGKHAARMARALYRASHEPGGRLLAKSPDDMMLDTMNQMIGAFQRKDAADFEALYGRLPKYEPG